MQISTGQFGLLLVLTSPSSRPPLKAELWLNLGTSARHRWGKVKRIEVMTYSPGWPRPCVALSIGKTKIQ